MLLLFSWYVVSDSLQPHELQHTKFLCPLLFPGICSNSCSLSQWCHPTISSSVAPFSFYPQSFPASGSFPVTQLFPSGGQSIRASASASVLLMNILDWFPLGLTGLISLLSKDSQESSPTPQFKSSILRWLAFFMVQLSHPYMTTGKTKDLTKWTFVSKVISLLFNMLSRFLIALPRNKCLLISWLQSPSAVVWNSRK